MTTVTIESVEQLQEVVRSTTRLAPRGGGSKSALSSVPDDATVLDLRGLSGMVEYEPGEFTFTARAGSPITEIAAQLAEHGQTLPWDPPLVEAGATLGGAIAAGLNGPGRQRYGGVRDFLIGARFVDGQGQLVRGGGKVVKNAAGFDLPKLMVGSLGRLGILTEVSFKVFPRSLAYCSVRAQVGGLSEISAALTRLACAPFDIEALDITAEDATVWLRIGGLPDVLAERAQRLISFLGRGDVVAPEEDARFWRSQREFAWLPAGWSLVKTPINLRSLTVLDAELAATNAIRRYSVGGNLAWIGWPAALNDLHALLVRLKLAGLVVLGSSSQPLIGIHSGQEMLRRVKSALDPQSRFLSFD